MTDKPFVSCLMPTKNRRRFVRRAIEMFLAQDYPGGAELIIIEDGEEDCCDLAIEAEFWDCHSMREGSNIRYLGYEGTLGAKLNFGARVAQGDVLVNYDDDDFHHPHRISAQVDHMRASGKPFVGFSSLVYWVEGEEEGLEYTDTRPWYCSGSTHCYTREYALQHPRPDKTVGEDSDAVALARRNDAVSTMSGCYYLVACKHGANCSQQAVNPLVAAIIEATGRMPDNYKPIPYERFQATVERWTLAPMLTAR